MYNNYFGFQETPFSIAPNPHFLYLSDRHREALAHLLYGVQGNGGFILLTGEVGTGKTTVCRSLLEQLPSEVDTAFIINPRLTVLELLAAICDDLGIKYPKKAGLKELIDKLSHFLLSSMENGRKTLLIIDEAQNLSPEVLEQLRLLTNLETNETKLLQIILIGQPELLELLSRNELRQLNQRITARFHLQALNKQEVGEYIAHRLSVARGKGDLFSPASIKKIFKLSGGIPRLINLLCDRSLLGAYAGNSLSVNPSIVNQAAKEIFGYQQESGLDHRFFWRKLSLYMSGVVMVVMLVTGATALMGRKDFQKWIELPSNSSLVSEAVPDNFSQAKQDYRQFDSDSQGYSDENAAVKDLLVLWGTPEVLIDADNPCFGAYKAGLACLKETGNLQDILNLDRPAIIRHENYYYNIIRSSMRGLELKGPETIYLTDSNDPILMEERNFILVWRIPPGYKSPLVPGDTGIAIDWLADQMAIANGEAAHISKGQSYNESLSEKVKRFQSTRGLDPNGIVDAHTLIHINSIQGLGIPFLKEKSA